MNPRVSTWRIMEQSHRKVLINFTEQFLSGVKESHFYLTTMCFCVEAPDCQASCFHIYSIHRDNGRLFNSPTVVNKLLFFASGVLNTCWITGNRKKEREASDNVKVVTFFCLCIPFKLGMHDIGEKKGKKRKCDTFVTAIYVSIWKG